MKRRVILVLAVAAGFVGCINWAGAEDEFCRENPTAAGCEAYLDAGSGGGGGGLGGGVGGGTGGGVSGGTGGGGDPDAGTGGGTGGGGATGPSQVTLNVSVAGGTTGQIMWLDGGVACPAGTCTLVVDAGTELRLRGASGRFGVLTGFSGCAQPAHGLCQLTVTGNPTITASFDRPNLVFVTSSTFPVGGFSLDGGDAIAYANSLCAFHAADAGLPGNFTAFLARPNPLRDPFAAVASARGWIRVDGKPAFDTLDVGSAYNLLYPLVLTEQGARLTSGVPIATGLSAAGGVGNTCGNFLATGQLSVGSPTAGGTRWFADNQGGPCPVAFNYHLACFGTDRSVPVQVDRTRPTRLAFITDAPWRVDGGLSAADSACATTATNSYGADGGTFWALLSSSGMSNPFQRIGNPSSTVPWARPDGVIVGPNPMGLRAEAVDVDAPLSNLGAWFWVGASGLHCDGWTNPSAGGNPPYGAAFESGSGWYPTFRIGPAVCGRTDLHLACFQQ
ncbi:MAG: hypothetical protein AMXMBFR34_23650 [Myxococcaceae bacterium]